MSITHRVKRLLGVSLAGAMVLALMPAGIAAADEHEDVEPDGVEACEGSEGLVEFNDSLGFFESEIECMAAFGITVGDADGNYNSTGTVTRQQMALFIARLASQALNGDIDSIPESEDDAFDDIANINPPEARDAINWLAALEITVGAEGGDSYNPSGDVTRQQMASFIARAHLALGVDFDGIEVDDERFTDVDADNVHVDNINLLAAAGVVEGTGDGTTYSPANSVTRGQMSAFIVRSIGVLESQDLWNGVPTADPIEVPVPVSNYDGPELAAASLGVVASDRFSVDYTFTEDVVVQGLDEGNFYLHSFVPGVVTLQAFSVTRPSPNVVRAVYMDDPDLIPVLTAASVSAVAAFNSEGVTNPEGSVAFGDGISFGAGDTLAPNLVDIEVGTNDDDEVIATFEFDKDASWFGGGFDAYVLVDEDGDTYGGTAFEDADEQGTSTHTINFDANLVEADIDGIVRGYVTAGGVASDLAFANPVQTVNIGAGALDDGPNLVEVEVDFDEAEVTYTFDMAVNLAADGEGFNIYYVDGATEESSDGSATRDSDTSFTVAFDDEDYLVNALVSGASVSPGAVEGATVPNDDNAWDSIGVNAVAFAAGEVASPVVEGFEVDTDTSIDPVSGDEEIDAFEITLIYSAPITDADPLLHYIYLEQFDGTDGRFSVADLDAGPDVSDIENGRITVTIDATEDEAVFDALVDGEVTLITVDFDAAELEIVRQAPGITLPTIQGALVVG